jgi:hypothetical protein
MCAHRRARTASSCYCCWADGTDAAKPLTIDDPFVLRLRAAFCRPPADPYFVSRRCCLHSTRFAPGIALGCPSRYSCSPIRSRLEAVPLAVQCALRRLACRTVSTVDTCSIAGDRHVTHVSPEPEPDARHSSARLSLRRWSVHPRRARWLDAERRPRRGLGRLASQTKYNGLRRHVSLMPAVATVAARRIHCRHRHHAVCRLGLGCATVSPI